MESSEEDDDFPSIERIIPQSKVDSLYQSHTEKVFLLSFYHLPTPILLIMFLISFFSFILISHFQFMCWIKLFIFLCASTNFFLFMWVFIFWSSYVGKISFCYLGIFYFWVSSTVHKVNRLDFSFNTGLHYSDSSSWLKCNVSIGDSFVFGVTPRLTLSIKS